jgi:hypothetical protein
MGFFINVFCFLLGLALFHVGMHIRNEPRVPPTPPLSTHPVFDMDDVSSNAIATTSEEGDDSDNSNINEEDGLGIVRINRQPIQKSAKGMDVDEELHRAMEDELALK